MAKITLYGFYKWMKNAGDDLFSELNVPAGLDKNTLIDNIIIRGGEYEVLYADPYFMQDAIRVWSNKWQSTFKRWVDAMAKDYDPLYNYDRYEEWTDNNTGTIDNKLSGTNSGTVTDTGSIHDQGTVRDTGNIHDQGTVRDTGNIHDLGTIKDTGTVKDTGDIKNSGTQKFDITEQHSGGDDTTTTRTGSETVDTDMDATTTKAAYNSNTLLPDNKVEQDGTVTTTYNSVKDVVNHDDSLKIVTDNDRTDDLTTTNNLTRTNDLTQTNDLTRTNDLTQTNDLTRTNDLTQTNDLTRTNNLTRTDNLAHSESSTRTDNMTSTHDAHIYGNIGVTTSSAMLAEYMDTQAKYQLVDQITDIFLREFVIPIF